MEKKITPLIACVGVDGAQIMRTSLKLLNILLINSSKSGTLWKPVSTI